MDELKYTRGEAIFEEFKKRLNSPDIREDERAYYSDIIHALDGYSYDTPIEPNKIYKALEQAEKQGKRVYIVPDDEFLEGGMRCGQCDGWTYHIELK